MAAKLKNKNFENIKIFEETDRVGGKSYDMFNEGNNGPHLHSFVVPGYFENVIPFVKQYTAADLLSIQNPAVSIIIIINRHIQKRDRQLLFWYHMISHIHHLI